MMHPPEPDPLLQLDPSQSPPSSQKPVKVLWLQVCALAGIQGAIVLVWVIYNLYLANLLQQFGFSAGAATTVVFVENLLAAGMEPIVGGLADLCQRWLGSRFPLIAVGMVLSAAFFVLIPILWILGSWGAGFSSLRVIFPIVLVLWALAMTLFRSPVLSLLGRYALNRRLPQAASLLTLTEGFARAGGFLASTWILGLGPVFAFGIGSTVLLLGAIVLLLVDSDRQVARSLKQPKSKSESKSKSKLVMLETIPPTATLKAKKPLSLGKLGWLLGTGVGVTLGFRLLLISLSQVLQILPLTETRASLILGVLFLSMSFSAIPLGRFGVRLGNHRGFVLGLAILAGLCAIVPFVPTPGFLLLLAIGMGMALGLVTNSGVPFALTLVPEGWASLGTAIYFSGGSIAATLLTGALANLPGLQPKTAAFLGSGAFLLAGFFVTSAVPLSPKQPEPKQPEPLNPPNNPPPRQTT